MSTRPRSGANRASISKRDHKRTILDKAVARSFTTSDAASCSTLKYRSRGCRKSNPARQEFLVLAALVGCGAREHHQGPHADTDADVRTGPTAPSRGETALDERRVRVGLVNRAMSQSWGAQLLWFAASVRAKPSDTNLTSTISTPVSSTSKLRSMR